MPALRDRELVQPFRPRSNFQRGRGFQFGKFLFRSTAIVVVLTLLGYLIVRVDQAPTARAAQTLDEDRFMVGAWLGDWPSSENGLIDDFEERTDTRLDMVDVFVDYHTPYANVTDTVRHIASQGAIPILTWEPHGYTMEQILEGTAKTPLRDKRTLTLDAYLEEFAVGTCDTFEATGVPVLIRPFHEMNGNWYSWGSAYERNGERPNSDETYRAAWIKTFNAFESRCPDGVKWVWAVNHFSTGGTTWMQTYPGVEYVDYVGIDGYNWGAHAEWGWQSFTTVFRPAYCAVTEATPHPVIVAEVGSTEYGGDKAAWIHDTFSDVQSGKYGRIRGVVWFNDPKYEVEVKGPMDWPIDSSNSASTAFAQSVGELQQATAGGATPGTQADICTRG